jgi:hypothetical protein
MINASIMESMGQNGQNKSDRDFSAPNDPYGSFSSKRWLVWDP